MNVTLASWHTRQSTSLPLCLVYMWQVHNRMLDNRPLIEWLAGSGTHPRSPVTLQPRAPYGSWSASGCTLLWWQGESTCCHIGNLGEVRKGKMIKRNAQKRGKRLTESLQTVLATVSWFILWFFWVLFLTVITHPIMECVNPSSFF